MKIKHLNWRVSRETVFIYTLLCVLFTNRANAKVQFMGMNVAGFEFGCQIDGSCPLSSIQPPTSVGPKQIAHFINDDGMNIFRFPVSWQYLTSSPTTATSTLSPPNFSTYDTLLQFCLQQPNTYCAIDLHNFARFNSAIIGQGGPSNDIFAGLWSALASHYASNPNIIFGLMNEPHDLDISTWADTVQAAVTAIRQAGATEQMILLPGSNFTSAGAWLENGSGDALLKVSNPDGSTEGLVMDLHKYLDINNSGEHSTCTTDNVVDAFEPVAEWLRQKGRVALVSETGAGRDASCFTDFCAQNAFLNQNSDVYLGYIAWGAGSFDSSYILSLTPTTQNGKLVDAALAAQCVVAPFASAGPATFVSSSSSDSPAATSTAAGAVGTGGGAGSGSSEGSEGGSGGGGSAATDNGVSSGSGSGSQTASASALASSSGAASATIAGATTSATTSSSGSGLGDDSSPSSAAQPTSSQGGGSPSQFLGGAAGSVTQFWEMVMVGLVAVVVGGMLV